MAAIFQLRRGTTGGKPTLIAGELYVDQTSENLIVGVNGSKEITLLKLNDINTGSLHLTGDITLSGSIYLGNAIADNISALGVFTTNLVPNPNNTIDLGTTSSYWRNVYATNISGAIAATNGVVSGSSQIVSILVPLNTFSGSQLTQNSALATISGSLILTASANTISIANLNLTTASLNTNVSNLNLTTASLNTNISNLNLTTASLNTSVTNLNLTSASINTSVSTLNTFSASVNTRFATLSTYTASVDNSIATLNTYSASLKNAIDVSGVGTGSTVTIKGNLQVQGTTTQVDSTTINLADNVIQLNAAGTSDGGLIVRDATGSSTTSGSFLWDVTNDYWKAGKFASESKILVAGGDGIISSSAQVNADSITNFDANVKEKLNADTVVSGSSQITFSGISSLPTLVSGSSQIVLNNADKTGFDTDDVSEGSRLYYTDARVKTKLNAETVVSGSSQVNLASVTGNSTSNVTEGSNLYYTDARVKTKLNAETVVSGSSQITYADISSIPAGIVSGSSQVTSLLPAGTISGSIQVLGGTGIVSGSSQITYTNISSIPAGILSGSAQVTPLLPAGVVSGSSQITTLGFISSSITASSLVTASVNINVLTFTKGNGSTFDLTVVASGTAPAGTISSSAQITAFGFISSSAAIPSGTVSGSSQVIGILDSLNTFSGSANTRFTEIGVVSGSLITSASAAKTTNDLQGVSITNINSTTASLNTSVSNLNTATSSYETKGRGIVSGSSQITFSGISSLPTLVSGSSQITYTSISSIPAGIVSGSTQVTPLLPAGVVSGSSQILGGSGIFSGSSQVNADSITNFDTNVKDKLNTDGVISGSSQIITSNSVTLGTHTTGNYIQTLTGTANQISVAGSGLESADVTLSLPQNIHTSATPQFSSLGIGTAASGVSGEIRATADITAFYSSDIRLKENIFPIPNALQKVNEISGNTYNWKEGFEEIHSHKGNDVGVIAQEIEIVLPEIVTNRDNGFKAVQYEKIIPLLIEAIKELSAKVKELENK